jgi:hypothetical protein
MISVTSLATSKPLSEPSVQQKPTESEIRDLLGAIASARYTAEWIKNEVQLPVRTERQVVNQPVPIRPIPIRPIVSARTEVASSPEVEIPQAPQIQPPRHLSSKLKNLACSSALLLG